jgi:hypothetical protein
MKRTFELNYELGSDSNSEEEEEVQNEIKKPKTINEALSYVKGCEKKKGKKRKIQKDGTEKEPDWKETLVAKEFDWDELEQIYWNKEVQSRTRKLTAGVSILKINPTVNYDILYQNKIQELATKMKKWNRNHIMIYFKYHYDNWYRVLPELSKYLHENEHEPDFLYKPFFLNYEKVTDEYFDAKFDAEYNNFS